MLLSIAKIRCWIKIAIYTNRGKIGIAKLKISKLLSIHIVIQLSQHILFNNFPFIGQTGGKSMELSIQERLKDPQLRQLIAAHIDDDSFCRYNTAGHKQNGPRPAGSPQGRLFQCPGGRPAGRFLTDRRGNRQSGQRPGRGGDGVYLQAAQAELWKLSDEERKWLKRIAQKSDLLKNPKPQRGRK